jgi:hypothetical protein
MCSVAYVSAHADSGRAGQASEESSTLLTTDIFPSLVRFDYRSAGLCHASEDLLDPASIAVRQSRDF